VTFSQVGMCVRFKLPSLRVFGTWIINIFSKIICEHHFLSGTTEQVIFYIDRDLGPEKVSAPGECVPALNLSILGMV